MPKTIPHPSLAKRLYKKTQDVLTFQTLVAPKLIKCLFWLVTLILIALAYQNFRLGSSHHLTAWRFLILGPVITRIICEWLLVHFNNHQLLRATVPTTTD